MHLWQLSSKGIYASAQCSLTSTCCYHRKHILTTVSNSLCGDREDCIMDEEVAVNDGSAVTTATKKQKYCTSILYLQ